MNTYHFRVTTLDSPGESFLVEVFADSYDLAVERLKDQYPEVTGFTSDT